MAMMECPNCGEQVSDKAKKCVHCGTILIAEEKRYCQECGAELEEGADVCPKCGCPAENVENNETQVPQQVEVTGVKIARKSKKIMAIVTVVLLIVALIAVAAVQGQKKKRVEEYDDSTNKYTRPDGYFVSDFNEALQNLYADPSFIGQVSSIEDNQDSVNSMMKKLKNPPDEYKDAYEAVTELYDAYLTLTNLATDPSGSLQTFSSNFSDADSEVVKRLDAVKMYLGE